VLALIETFVKGIGNFLAAHSFIIFLTKQIPSSLLFCLFDPVSIISQIVCFYCLE